VVWARSQRLLALLTRWWQALQPVNDLAFCAGLKSQEQSYADQEYDCYD
jgi:hypothetical protein